jgi:hypothetical protein
MRLAEQLACMGERGMHIGFWWKKQEKDHKEDLDVGGRIKIKWSLER